MVFVVILILCATLQLLLPWWCIIAIAFITCSLIGRTPKISFWQAFLAVFLLWAGMCVYESLPNGNRLSNRVAIMFGLQYWPVLIFVTSLLAALVAGFSGLCGYHFRKAILAIKGNATH